MLICFVSNYPGEKLHNIPYVEDSTNWENLYKRGVNMRQNVINGRYVFCFLLSCKLNLSFKLVHNQTYSLRHRCTVIDSRKQKCERGDYL